MQWNARLSVEFDKIKLNILNKTCYSTEIVLELQYYRKHYNIGPKSVSLLRYYR